MLSNSNKCVYNQILNNKWEYTSRYSTTQNICRTYHYMVQDKKANKNMQQRRHK